MKRYSNYELLRLVAMAMIVISHCNYHGVLCSGEKSGIEIWERGSLLYKSVVSFSILGTIGAGLFFMLTGYFLCTKEFSSIKSIKRICMETLFYVIFAIMISIIVGAFSNAVDKEIIKNLVWLVFTPFSGSVWWFVTAIFFYTCGVMFREYLEDRMSLTICLICIWGGVMLNGCLRYILFSFSGTDNITEQIIATLLGILLRLFAEPLAVWGFFGAFSHIRLHSKRINSLASHVFGVYLFHDSPIMRKVIWGFLKPAEYYNIWLFYIYVPFCLVLVYVIGIIIDYIREKTFERWGTNVCNRMIAKFCKIGFKNDI